MSAAPDRTLASPSDDLAAYYTLTRRAFERLAPHYDAIALLVTPLRKRVVAFSGARPKARVLDVATGTGAQALAFARRGFDVTAIDLVEAMLSVAQGKRGSELVRFQRMDAAALAFGDASFDVTTISFALHDMPAAVREQVVREMVRVTRRDGRVLVVDYGLPTRRWWRWLAPRLIATWERGWYREFLRADLDALLTRAGVVLDDQRTAWCGAVRMLRGHVRAAS